MLNEKEEKVLLNLIETEKLKIKEEEDIDISTDNIVLDETLSFEEARALIVQGLKAEKDKLVNFRDNPSSSAVKVTNPFPNITLKQYKHLLNNLPDSININDADKNNDYDGLKSFIREEYGIEIPLTLKEEKEKAEFEEAQAEKVNLEKLKQEELKAISEWKKQFKPSMIIKSPAYFEMEKYVEMVVQGLSNFCIIWSSGGLSKSWSSQAILKKNKINYAYLNSLTTPLELYNFLYDNSQDKIILLDDLYGIWQNNSVISLLKNATELNGNRRISWNSTTSKLDGRATTIPFSSRIILLTNDLPAKNPHTQALMNRAFLCRLNFSYQEIIDILKEVSQKPYQTLTETERKEVFEFIERNTSEATKDLSIRTLVKCYHFYMFDKSCWKELAGKILLIDKRKETVLELINSGMPIKEQVKSFQDKYNESRNTFYRIKKELQKGITV